MTGLLPLILISLFALWGLYRIVFVHIPVVTRFNPWRVKRRAALAVSKWITVLLLGLPGATLIQPNAHFVPVLLWILTATFVFFFSFFILTVIGRERIYEPEEDTKNTPEVPK